MIKALFFTIISTFVTGLNAQEKASIDALNNLPFATKIEKAYSLDDDYLRNAKKAKQINYVLGEAESYSNLSLVYYFQGKYERDLHYSLKAIGLFESINAKEKIAIEYGEVGYRMKNRSLVKARQFMQKGKHIAEQYRLQKPLLSIYNNYGVLKEMEKDYDSAFYFYKNGLQIKEQIKDSAGIPYSLNNIAGLYVIQKKFDEAKPLYDRAIAIRIKINDQIGICENYTYYGDLYAAQKQYLVAISWYKKSLEKALEYHYTDMIQNNYKMIAMNYEALNNKEDALSNFKKYNQYKDSLLNTETNAKIAELEVKYETKEKEKLLLEKSMEAQYQKNVILLLTGLALFIGFVAFLIYRQQKLKNKQQAQEFQLKAAIAQIETQNQLHEQRLSISRDLHDNIGAQLTFIISSVDNISFAFKFQNEKLEGKLQNISSFAKSTIDELRDTIWAMNSDEILVEDLRSRLLNFIEKAKTAKEEIDFQFTIDKRLSNLKLNSVFGMNVYRVVQEATNNAIKYANPKHIAVDMAMVEKQLLIKISDDGSGFDIENTTKGNGLSIMEKRINNIGGIYSIQSQPGKGTLITLNLALK